MIRSKAFHAPVALGVLVAATTAAADTVTIVAAKDNTLIEDPEGSVSNGAGPGVFVGRTGNFDAGTVRRAVIAFDVAGAVPAGSLINSATLTMTVVMSAPGAGVQPIALHRLLADWGEGTSSFPGGVGAPATEDDATWIHTFFPDELWATPGGDFDATESASIDAGVSGPQVWGSTAGMVQDVQQWLDDPAGNFGWLLLGNEAELHTAKMLASREAADDTTWPMLTIEFTPPECPWDCSDVDGTVGIVDLIALLGQWGGGGSCDFDGGGVGITDLIKLLGAWGPCS